MRDSTDKYPHGDYEIYHRNRFQTIWNHIQINIHEQRTFFPATCYKKKYELFVLINKW